MPINRNNDKPSNQEWNNVVNITNNDSANNSSRFSSSKSSKSSRAQSQISTSPREMIIQYGNNHTINNYN